MQEMKYFNEGNDCDICKNQLMTGRDGTVEDCRRRQNGLSCRFEERDIRTCPVCEHEVDREDMYFTKDCHGIPFRLVCDRCYQRIMSKGYQNVLVGIDYLSELIERYGTIQDALAAYNYGEQGAKQHLWKNGIYVYEYNQTIISDLSCPI